MTNTQQILNGLARAKATFQLRSITAAMGIDPVTQWSEYRAHGGKLDYTAWQEKQERETV